MKTTFCFISMMALAILSPRIAHSQKNSNENLIRQYYAAYEKKDWSILESILDNGFTFSSPVDNHIVLSDYKMKCWPNAGKTKKFEIVKMVVQGDDGFVIYNGYTTDGSLFRNSEHFKFKNGKIIENECFFGPGVNYPNKKEK